MKRGIFYKNLFSEEMTFNLRFWYSKRHMMQGSVEKLFQVEGTETANTQKISSGLSVWLEKKSFCGLNISISHWTGTSL